MKREKGRLIETVQLWRTKEREKEVSMYKMEGHRERNIGKDKERKREREKKKERKLVQL